MKKKKSDLDNTFNDLLEKVNDAIEQTHVAVNNRSERNNLIDVRMRYDSLNQGKTYLLQIRVD